MDVHHHHWQLHKTWRDSESAKRVLSKDDLRRNMAHSNLSAADVTLYPATVMLMGLCLSKHAAHLGKGADYFFAVFVSQICRDCILWKFKKNPNIFCSNFSPTYFLFSPAAGATSEWSTPSARSRPTTTRSTPLCTASELTGVTGTFTASSTWPCFVSAVQVLLVPRENERVWNAHAWAYVPQQIAPAY